MAVLVVGVITALLPTHGTASIVAGGRFDNVNGELDANYRKIAHYSSKAGWRPGYGGYGFKPQHQVYALAADPALR